jgi:hypothetical protein
MIVLAFLLEMLSRRWASFFRAGISPIVSVLNDVGINANFLG